MKVLVIIPIQEELEPFLEGCMKREIKSREAMLGRLLVVRLVKTGITVARGGLGKVQFGIQTQHLLDTSPGWDLVICIGAAGALVDGLSAGDVVVATETVEHDIHNKFGPPLLPRFQSDERALRGFRSLPKDSYPFRVHFGPVASGDEDVIDSERKRDLHTLTGALAVAWEGAGGARACQFSGVPFIEVRAITDSADSEAAASFETNLEMAMCNIATLITDWTKGLDI